MAIRVGDYRISLDVKDPEANLNFVSHAHSDHTGGVRKNSEILCSEVTKDLVETRIGYRLKNAQMPDGVSLLDAGHMLGSKQLYAESVDGCSLVYTGDYQMQKCLVAPKIEVRQADILIIDSTYPYPDVTFDEKEEVIDCIQHYIKSKMAIGTVMFGSYSMGKAQELVKICNDMGIAPIVDSSIAKINGVYSKHGVRLDSITHDLNDVGEEHFREPVWIMSMGRMDKVRDNVHSKNMKVFTAVATGFALTQRFGTDVQFALSDHADFKQAIEYIEICRPKMIYTRGTGCEVFAKNLNAHGYKAQRLHNGGINKLLLNYI